ncbi:SF1B family DNA helicase RecD2 [Ornithinibacillus contaminans]|uniref:SF1B family DNA helicase RecD2 n=1 Tax=Ornithinibacillus contaminans TaxID=694055 RepID=UPI00069FDC7D|nr:ATP-dependent RecD-like DNA helicase [Ornithinibacillus contaminans]
MNVQLEQEELVAVKGVITNIIFHKEDYMIATLQADDNEITFKGTIFGLEKDEEVTLKGNWVEHHQYGKQLEVKKWERPIPQTKEKALAYLSSKFVKGCGKVQAKKIVEKLGDNAVQTIMREQEKCLKGIKGIGEKKAISIAKSVKETYELQNIISELTVIGVSPDLTIKLYQEYGSNTVSILKNNPYKLTEMKMISFPKVDEIAQRIGISPLSGFRIEACINYVLTEMCFKFGHCFIPETDLIQQTITMLNHNATEIADTQSVLQSIYTLEDNTIIIEEGKVYPKNFYIYENKIAERVNILLKYKTNHAINEQRLDELIKTYQLQNNMILAKDQIRAIKEAFKSNVVVLTGNPGTGKTTVVKAIIFVYRKLFPNDLISLSAPTGRASRKLQETTNHEALTNHRLLGYSKDGFEYNHENQLSHNFFIVDEMSMVDLHMTYSLLQAISKGSRVLFIGDVDQLPSVNAGNVLKDLLDSGVPNVRLKEIFRQAKESQIITNAHRVNKGNSIIIDDSKDDMYFINQQNNSNIADMTIKSALRFIELGYSLSDILVLSPMRKGIIGTIELNKRLQEVLNPFSFNKSEIRYGEKVFREGDKVMQLINRVNKGVFNGDIGIITYIGKTTTLDENEEKIEVDIIQCDYQGVTVTYKKDEWKEIELGYSITIHKSQGGQAPIVIIPMSTAHYIMLARNLVYTGMTRAESVLVFIGQSKALNIAISNNKITDRNTTLAPKINNRIKNITEFRISLPQTTSSVV